VPVLAATNHHDYEGSCKELSYASEMNIVQLISLVSRLPMICSQINKKKTTVHTYTFLSALLFVVCLLNLFPS
jgi:hypothetical protein